MGAVNNEEEYRRELEEFVSNHGGSTSREIILLILPNILSILLTSTIAALIRKTINQYVLIALEFIFIIIPCVLYCTILSNYTITITLIILIIIIMNFLYIIKMSNCKLKFNYREIMTKHRPFITNFRSLTYILTAICILAVDFKIFPRKFAKTELYGYSLMDTGVGLFVISNAIVAPETHNININNNYNNINNKSFILLLYYNIKNCIKNTGILFILGFVRYLTVELLNYQRHTSEYGVHWNFFITLAFVKLFTSAISSTINSKYSLISGLWILIMHEYALSTNGLKEWILGNSSRNDFLSANREGIVSVPGYVGLYFIGISLGRIINKTYENYNCNNINKRSNDRIKIDGKLFGYKLSFEYNKSMVLCIKLSLIAPHTCVITIICDYYFGISRRLTNCGYCAWILTLTTVLLTIVILIEILTDILINIINNNDIINNKNKYIIKSDMKYCNGEFNLNEIIRKSPLIFDAINYNGLLFFLTCNLFTGIINMLIRTLYVDSNISLQIIILYIAINIIISIILYRNKIQFKF